MKKITSLLLMLLFAVTAANAKYTYWGYAGKTAGQSTFRMAASAHVRARLPYTFLQKWHRCTRV